jgi:hypothetical protein
MPTQCIVAKAISHPPAKHRQGTTSHTKFTASETGSGTVRVTNQRYAEALKPSGQPTRIKVRVTQKRQMVPSRTAIEPAVNLNVFSNVCPSVDLRLFLPLMRDDPANSPEGEAYAHGRPEKERVNHAQALPSRILTRVGKKTTQDTAAETKAQSNNGCQTQTRNQAKVGSQPEPGYQSGHDEEDQVAESISDSRTSQGMLLTLFQGIHSLPAASSNTAKVLST